MESFETRVSFWDFPKKNKDETNWDGRSTNLSFLSFPWDASACSIGRCMFSFFFSLIDVIAEHYYLENQKGCNIGLILFYLIYLKINVFRNHMKRCPINMIFVIIDVLDEFYKVNSTSNLNGFPGKGPKTR